MDPYQLDLSKCLKSQHQQTSTVPKSANPKESPAWCCNFEYRPTSFEPWFQHLHRRWQPTWGQHLQSQKCWNLQYTRYIAWYHHLIFKIFKSFMAMVSESIRFERRGTSHCWRMWSASLTGHDNQWQSEGLRSNSENGCLNFIQYIWQWLSKGCFLLSVLPLATLIGI